MNSPLPPPRDRAEALSRISKTGRPGRSFARDLRILELSAEGLRPREILVRMLEEGFSCSRWAVYTALQAERLRLQAFLLESAEGTSVPGTPEELGPSAVSSAYSESGGVYAPCAEGKKNRPG